MKVNFNFSEAPAPDKIVFEQVFAEKPGGGMVKNPTSDIQAGTAVGANADGLYVPADGTTIKGQYLTGSIVYANKGDQPVRLVNGANVRKENVSISEAVLAQLKTINLV